MFDAVALGELLIDFTQCGNSSDGNALFQRNAGGATANVMAGLSAYGHKTAFIGKVGNDDCGKFLRDTLNSFGINTDSLLSTDNAFTTLAFVSLDKNGERSFSFSRNPGADTLLNETEIDEKVIAESKILHIGSLSATTEPIKSATFKALDIAKKNGILISFDPNYRPSLWKSKDEAVNAMKEISIYCDMIKATDEEAEMITGCNDPYDAAIKLNEMGIGIVAVTLGPKGSVICINGKTNLVETEELIPVDTTGAGDAFWAGFIHKFLESKKTIIDLNMDDVVSFAKCGNYTASKCIMKTGAMLKECDLH